MTWPRGVDRNSTVLASKAYNTSRLDGSIRVGASNPVAPHWNPSQTFCRFLHSVARSHRRFAHYTETSFSTSVHLSSSFRPFVHSAWFFRNSSACAFNSSRSLGACSRVRSGISEGFDCRL